MISISLILINLNLSPAQSITRCYAYELYIFKDYHVVRDYHVPIVAVKKRDYHVPLVAVLKNQPHYTVRESQLRCSVPLLPHATALSRSVHLVSATIIHSLLCILMVSVAKQRPRDLL